MALKNKPIEINVTKKKVLKNVLVISLGFFGLFGSSSGIGSIQTSVNKQMAITAGWTIYVSLVVSCVFLPTLMIRKLGEKWTMPICMLCYTPYLFAQLHPAYYTLVPAAFLMGIGAAPLWSAKCTYLTQVGGVYANLINEKREVIVTRFFGIFFFFFHLSMVVGNFVTSFMLSKVAEATTLSEEQSGVCGSDFCPAYFGNLTAESGNEKEQRDDAIANLTYIFLALTFVAIAIMCIFVDRLEEVAVKAEEDTSSSVKEYLTASCRHMMKLKQFFIIPLTMWSGWEQNFDGNDFPSAYITCGMGVHMVGYVMICMGVFDAVFSIGFTPLIKKFGRVSIFTIAFIINLSLLTVLMVWKPNPHQVGVYFAIAAFWGIADAVWQTQINAFYGVIFSNSSEAAFANYRLWESLGFMFAYITSGSLCVSTKIYILYTFLIVGMSGYYTIEYMEYKQNTETKEDKE